MADKFETAYPFLYNYINYAIYRMVCNRYIKEYDRSVG